VEVCQAAPEWLVSDERADHLRTAGGERRSGRTRAAVMRHGGDPGEQQLVIDLVHEQRLVGPIGGRKAAPAGADDQAYPGPTGRIEHDRGGGCGVTTGHRAEPDEHRRITGRQELLHVHR